jgi:hypothetical protein
MPPSLRLARRTILASVVPFSAALASNPETASLLVPGPEMGAQFRWLQRCRRRPRSASWRWVDRTA